MAWQKWCAKAIYRRKFVNFAKNHMLGVKNGRVIGTLFAFALKDANLRLRSSHKRF